MVELLLMQLGPKLVTEKLLPSVVRLVTQMEELLLIWLDSYLVILKVPLSF